MSTSSVSVSGLLSSINDAFSGKTSGIDVASTVSELMQAERQPETQMQQQQSDISGQVSLLTTINQDLSALQTAAQALTDPTGVFDQKEVASSQNGIVTATADPSAAVGVHTVTVSKLATISSAYSDPVSSTTNLGGTEIDVAYGPAGQPTSSDKIMVPASDTTLQQVVSYINSSQNNFGVTASVVTDTQGSRLSLESKSSGAAGNLTVRSSSLNFTQGVTGVDAKLVVDGAPLDSATNTVTGAITGVTLNLSSADANTQAVLNVGADTTQVAQALTTFVNAYNTVIGDINTQYSAGSSGNEGPLAGDTSLRNLQSQLLSAISFAPAGTGQYINLPSLGIEMQDDGTLQVNSSVTADALSNNYAAFQNFFQSTSPQGFGEYFNSQMTQLTNPITGPISADIKGLNQTSQSLSADISNFEARMTGVQQELTQQYSALNALLVQYPLEMQQVDEQLGSLPGSTQSSSQSV